MRQRGANHYACAEVGRVHVLPKGGSWRSPVASCPRMEPETWRETASLPGKNAASPDGAAHGQESWKKRPSECLCPAGTRCSYGNVNRFASGKAEKIFPRRQNQTALS